MKTSLFGDLLLDRNPKPASKVSLTPAQREALKALVNDRQRTATGAEPHDPIQAKRDRDAINKRNWRERNPGKDAEIGRRVRANMDEARRERRLEYNRKWQKENRDKANGYRRASRARARAAAGLPPVQPRVPGYCGNGLHKMTAENSASNYRGGYRCRTCLLASQKVFRERKKDKVGRKRGD